MRENKRIMATKRMAINGVLISIYVVLRFFNIPFGNSFRFTLAPFPVILCALLYGPIDGLLVGFVGEFLSQVLGPYGLTPTTLLWCVGEAVRGGVLGLCTVLFLRRWLFLSQRPSWKQLVFLLTCCVVTGILASLGQTFALYVDSKMFGYYRYEIVFGVLVWRMVIYALLAGIFGYLSLPVIHALRKAKFV